MIDAMLHLTAALLFLCHPSYQEPPEPVAVPNPPPGPAAAVVQLESGELIAAFGSGVIEILDPITGAHVSTYRQAARPARIDRLSLSPQDDKLAVLWADGHIEIAALGDAPHAAEPDRQGESQVGVIPGWSTPSEKRNRLQWTASGKHLVTWWESGYHGAPAQTVQVWNADGSLHWQGPIASDVTVHPKVDRIAFVEIDRVQVGWPPNSLQLVELPGAFAAISYSPSGSLLAVGGSDRMIPGEGAKRRFTERGGGRHARLTILDGKSHEVLHRMDPSAEDIFPRQWLHCIAWSPDGTRIACGSSKGFVTSVVRVRDYGIEFTDFDNGRMWSRHALEWISDGLILVLGGGTEAMLYNVDSANHRGATPLGQWSGACLLKGTQDVIALTKTGIARITPKGMTVRWRK